MAEVLMLHRDEEIRAALRLALEDEGHIVREAANPMVALAELRTCPECLVVLFSDGHGAEPAGAFLTAVVADGDLAARHAFVFLTTTPERIPPDAQALLDALPAPVVGLPCDLDSLLAVVAEVAARLPAK